MENEYGILVLGDPRFEIIQIVFCVTSWIATIFILLRIDEVALEEVDLLLILHIGCIIKAHLVKVAEDLLNQNRTVVAE